MSQCPISYISCQFFPVNIKNGEVNYSSKTNLLSHNGICMQRILTLLPNSYVFTKNNHLCKQCQGTFCHHHLIHSFPNKLYNSMCILVNSCQFISLLDSGSCQISMSAQVGPGMLGEAVTQLEITTQLANVIIILPINLVTSKTQQALIETIWPCSVCVNQKPTTLWLPIPPHPSPVCIHLCSLDWKSVMCW